MILSLDEHIVALEKQLQTQLASSLSVEREFLEALATVKETKARTNRKKIILARLKEMEMEAKQKESVRSILEEGKLVENLFDGNKGTYEFHEKEIAEREIILDERLFQLGQKTRALDEREKRVEEKERMKFDFEGHQLQTRDTHLQHQEAILKNTEDILAAKVDELVFSLHAQNDQLTQQLLQQETEKKKLEQRVLALETQLHQTQVVSFHEPLMSFDKLNQESLSEVKRETAFSNPFSPFSSTSSNVSNKQVAGLIEEKKQPNWIHYQRQAVDKTEDLVKKLEQRELELMQEAEESRREILRLQELLKAVDIATDYPLLPDNPSISLLTSPIPSFDELFPASVSNGFETEQTNQLGQHSSQELGLSDFPSVVVAPLSLTSAPTRVPPPPPPRKSEAKLDSKTPSINEAAVAPAHNQGVDLMSDLLAEFESAGSTK